MAVPRPCATGARGVAGLQHCRELGTPRRRSSTPSTSSVSRSTGAVLLASAATTCSGVPACPVAGGDQEGRPVDAEEAVPAGSCRVRSGAPNQPPGEPAWATVPLLGQANYAHKPPALAGGGGDGAAATRRGRVAARDLDRSLQADARASLALPRCRPTERRQKLPSGRCWASGRHAAGVRPPEPGGGVEIQAGGAPGSSSIASPATPRARRPQWRAWPTARWRRAADPGGASIPAQALPSPGALRVARSYSCSRR